MVRGKRDCHARILPALRFVPVLERKGADELSFSLGALESPTGVRVERHIFCAHKGDYYQIGEDGVPRTP